MSEPQTKPIKLAGKAGILIRYGTAYDNGFPGMIGARDSNAEDFRYLDAQLRCFLARVREVLRAKKTNMVI